MATPPPQTDRTPPTTEPGEPDGTTTQYTSVADAPEQLSLLDDNHARAILTCLASGPRGGRALAEACDISRAIAYRRLNRLEEAGFVSPHLRPDPDGHHRNVYHLVRDRLTVVIGDGAITVTVGQTEP